MKKLFVLTALVLLAGAVMMFTGCSEETFNFTFYNESTYEVRVECDDLDPSVFVIQPGYNKTATSTKTSVKFEVFLTSSNKASDYIKLVTSDNSVYIQNK